MSEPWKVANCQGIRVHYQDALDGGGLWMSPWLVDFFDRRSIPKQQRIYEWCAGPAFLAFSLLGKGMCETLCLADINPRAVEACQRTIRDNGLSDRVSVYLSDNLKSIPETEKWDIVVSNPIHFADAYPGDILRYDEGWQTHSEFFADVGKFLKRSGVVLLQENNWGSTVQTFEQMIDDAGLKTIFTDNALPERTDGDHIYLLGAIRKEDRLPQWALGPTPLAPYHVGDRIDFARTGYPERYFTRGWSSPESWGTWTNGEIAELRLQPTKPHGALELVTEARAFVGPSLPAQVVDVMVNGNAVAQLTFESPDAVEKRLRLPLSAVKPEGDIILTFRVPTAKSPAELGMSSDPRQLGIGVISARLQSVAS